MYKCSKLYLMIIQEYQLLYCNTVESLILYTHLWTKQKYPDYQDVLIFQASLSPKE